MSKAANVMHAWVFFARSNLAPVAFFDRVREATRANFTRQGKTPLGNESSTTRFKLSQFAANMYDAVMLFAKATSSKLRSSLSNGRIVAELMLNTSFDGMTGRVELDGNGDLKESIRAMNFLTGPDGTMQSKQVGQYDALGRHYLPDPNCAVLWPGGVDTVPIDSASPPTFNTVWLLLAAGMAAIVVLVGLVVFVKSKGDHLQVILTLLLRESVELVGAFCLEIADVATDIISYFQVVEGDGKLYLARYKMAYLTALSFGVVGTTVSVIYRLRSALLVRAHIQKVDESAVHMALGVTVIDSEARRQMQQYEWELVQMHRQRVSLLLTLLTMVVQGAV